MPSLLAPGELAALQPYLIGEHPRDDGEWDMFCPLHQDSQRSASLNIKKAEWFCHAGCGGGDISGLIGRSGEWLAPGANNGNGKVVAPSRPPVQMSRALTAMWHKALLADGPPRKNLLELRGINEHTIAAFGLGWCAEQRAYTIPVYGEPGELLNVRFYTPRPQLGRRKIWSVRGHGERRLYPLSSLTADTLIVCEGELDALLTIQHGFAAITRTGGAAEWSAAWRDLFAGKTVYLCHDCDKAGEAGNAKVGRALQKVATCKVLRLPFAVTEDHGKDLTDFWLEGGTAAELRQLMAEAMPFGDERTQPLDIPDSSVQEAFDSAKVGRPLRLAVTTRGKQEPGYSVPGEYQLDCDRGAGPKCAGCPLSSKSGAVRRKIEASDPINLKLIGCKEHVAADWLRQHYGALKCNRLEVEVLGHQAVELLYARPSIDRQVGDNMDPGDYKPIKLVSVGRHDTTANATIQVTGALHPSPNSHANEFLVWDVNPMQTSLDTFQLTPAMHTEMKVFEPVGKQRPLEKAVEIAQELSVTVTRIYGLARMHVAMDLVFHSLLSFEFEGQPIDRGWLELLVVGDTRTGKSEAAAKLLQHYGAGELISCEAASFAGVIGGLQQYAGKEWVVSWGAIPVNDRRLVVLDEVGGLAPDQIAQLSSVRSSGVAQLTKIQSEQTYARTRLIWLGNPRNGTMSDYTYGVDALVPLIGNMEDVARFDFATSVRTGQVAAERINRHHARGRVAHSEAACRTLLRWAWSRKPEQVVWAQGAAEVAYQAALDMAARYTEYPPLVQGANIRKKLARLACALAARTHSCDESGECVVVKQVHVLDAVRLLDSIYADQGFGYLERSTEAKRDAAHAESQVEATIRFLPSRPGLGKFIRSSGKFRKQDLEEVLDIGREEAHAVIHHLMAARMLKRVGAYNVATPILQDILRRYKGE